MKTSGAPANSTQSFTPTSTSSAASCSRTLVSLAVEIWALTGLVKVQIRACATAWLQRRRDAILASALELRVEWVLFSGFLDMGDSIGFSMGCGMGRNGLYIMCNKRLLLRFHPIPYLLSADLLGIDADLPD